MNIDDYIKGRRSLPQPLSQKDLLELIKMAQSGSSEAESKIVLYNLRLVFYLVGKVSSIGELNEDMISAGIIGLLKAIRGYKFDKNIYFSTFASNCIHNQIINYIRDSKMNRVEDSIDRPFLHQEDEKNNCINAYLKDGVCIEEDYEKKELYKRINEIICELPEFKRKVIVLYFGFYTSDCHSTEEIAGMFGISKTYVSKIINECVMKIGNALESDEFIDLFHTKKKKKTESIYSFFNGCSKEKVDLLINCLSQEEQKLIDLYFNKGIPLTREEYDYLFNCLIVNMRDFLGVVSEEKPKRKIRKKKSATL